MIISGATLLVSIFNRSDLPLDPASVSIILCGIPIILEAVTGFCRSRGYCLPCTAGIDIPQAARMAMPLRCSPYQPCMSDKWYNKMHLIETCVHCDECKSRCPCGLDTPKLLQEMLKDYVDFCEKHLND